jgi:LysM repeat protein
VSWIAIEEIADLKAANKPFVWFGRIAVMGLLLLLAGCFRSAGDTIQPTIDPNTSGTTPVGGDATQSVATATLPPITILAPATSTEAAEDNSPTPTAEALSGDDESVTPSSALESTPQFITPGAPLAPITFEAPEATSDAEALAVEAGDEEDSSDATPTRVRPEGTPDPDCIYIVEPGDSLYLIAINHDTTINGLLEANPDLEGDPPVLQLGQEIVLSDCGDEADAAETDEAPTATPTRAGTPSGEEEVYVVEPGDTLFTIAQRFGVTVNELMEANDLDNPNLLSIGQELIIPPDEDE